MSQVFQNQAHAAQSILDTFMNTEIRYSILRADVQSGKTGTYHCLIRQMFEKKMIDRVYIICGSHETELLTQCIKDVSEWHGDAVYRDSIKVVFRQHFKGVVMNTKRTLIINDETHLVQGVDQTLHKFMGKHNLSMAGTSSNMILSNTYILSVDATPFAEEAVLEYGLCLPKQKVILENGQGYYGPQHYYRDGLIQETFDLSSMRGQYNFMRLLNKNSKKYILVRIQEKTNKQVKYIKLYAEMANCNIVNFTSHYADNKTQIAITKKEADEHYRKYKIRIPNLEEEPEKTTVVILDGRLRCGKRVPKKYIGFVWESSTTTNTDTIVQGLLGRMCGYQGDNIYNVPTDSKPHIFIPKRILAKPTIRKVVHMSDFERYISSSYGSPVAARYGTNIIPGSVQNKAMRDGKEVTQCVPIRFHIPTSIIINPEEGPCNINTLDDLTIKEQCLKQIKLDRNRIIEQNNLLTNDQKLEINIILDTFTSRECHIRHYKNKSNTNMHKCHVEGWKNNTASTEVISDSAEITFCVVFEGFEQEPNEYNYTSRAGEVFAIFYTYAPGYTHAINKESRISRHNGRSVFSIQSTTELLDCPGGAIYGFSPKILSSAEIFYKEMDRFIAWSKEDVGIVSRKLTALYNGETILFPRNVYGNDLSIFKLKIQQLQDKHGVRISYDIAKRRPRICDNNYIGMDHQIKYISWE
jgi:hypothetical protein